MNRKIAFRAWNKKNKIMINAIFVGLGKVYGMTKIFKPSKELEDVILMQYTGLKDKNGKEIYEGDIIQWINRTTNGGMKDITVIEYDDKDASFYIGSWYDRDFPDTSQKALILGNIYENPELLEEVEEIPIMKGTREALDKIVI